MTAPAPIQDAVICGWFVLAAAAFWSPYLTASPLPGGLLNALYAVFLLISLATLALRLLRRSGESGTDLFAASRHSRKEDASRRGR